MPTFGARVGANVRDDRIEHGLSGIVAGGPSDARRVRMGFHTVTNARQSVAIRASIWACSSGRAAAASAADAFGIVIASRSALAAGQSAPMHVTIQSVLQC